MDPVGSGTAGLAGEYTATGKSIECGNCYGYILGLSEEVLDGGFREAVEAPGSLSLNASWLVQVGGDLALCHEPELVHV